MVELMVQIGLEKNDTVAVLVTGSMPGGNIAVLTALKALGVNPVVITSVGASQWGANHTDFTWLDMEKILYKAGLIPNRSIAASIGGRNDMGRLLSPEGRNIINTNIAKHGLPLIKKNKLADNIDHRMELFKNITKIDNYCALINVGGGVASLGTSFNSKLLPAGIVYRSDVQNISLQDGGIEGVLSKFSKNDIPVLHVLNIKSLTKKLGMPFAPIPLPDIGVGALYAVEKYNLLVAFVCLIALCSSVFVVGYQSKKEIKEHLINHEPDSLL
jgi:poly-gamma-glutamate system protein